MVIVRLLGGFGNQMFQYATARHIAVLNKTIVKIDLSGFDKKQYKKGDTYRELKLNAFKLKAETATIEEIDRVRKYKPSIFKQIKSRLLQNYTSIFSKPELYEKELFCFDPTVLKAPSNSYLTGYWQSPKYFDSIRTILLKDFEFRENPTKVDYPYLNNIQQGNSVSIHIRRGDYVSNPEYFKIHGLCSLEYYQSAIEYICRKIENPVFYIFSDDMDWVKKNIQLKETSFYVTDTPSGKDYFEMHLMSLCKHNIIANSSFSWWGAWLNQNSKKIVIAPKQWMKDPTIDTTDLIPVNWIRI